MKIEILGPKCKSLMVLVDRMRRPAEIVKVDDIAEIVKRGVLEERRDSAVGRTDRGMAQKSVRVMEV